MRRFAMGALAALVVATVIFLCTHPFVRAALNQWRYSLHKVDDATLYQTRKQVEDTCRGMIASYTADKLRFEQYSSSDSDEQKSWGEQAKMRANQTAASYNEYILKNSYVFEGNVPSDILGQLEYLG